MFTNADLSIVVVNEDGFKYLQPINNEVQTRFDKESKELLAKITKEEREKFCEKEGVTKKTPEEIKVIKDAQHKAMQEKLAKAKAKEEEKENVQ